MSDSVQGGMVEFCRILNVDPVTLFTDKRAAEIKFIKGMYFHLMKRAGYTYGQIATIASINQITVSRYAKKAVVDLQKRKNPSHTSMYEKVKHIKILFADDYTDLREKYGNIKRKGLKAAVN